MFIKIKKAWGLIFRLLYGNIAYAKRIGVKVGQNCRLYIHHWGSEPFLISIGDNVTISQGVTILTHDGSLSICRDEKGRRFSYKPVSIGNSVFIGAGAIIMPGVIIEDFSIVGAGAVVTKSVPSGSIVVGSPAKVIGDFEAFKTKVLAKYPSEEDRMAYGDYQKFVLDYVEGQMKPFLGK